MKQGTKRTVATNVPGMIKDLTSGAILNTDVSSYRAFAERRVTAKRIAKLEDTVQALMARVLALEGMKS